MSFVNVNKAKSYYKSFKTLTDTQEKSGQPMHFNGKEKKHKALDVSKTPTSQKQLKGGL